VVGRPKDKACATAKVLFAVIQHWYILNASPPMHHNVRDILFFFFDFENKFIIGIGSKGKRASTEYQL
jgi:hypothetical protein